VSGSPSARAARWGLAVLTLVNLLNYLDRFVVAALFESLRQSPMRPTDAQLGWLVTAFLVVYTIASPAFAWLADRGASRTRLIALGVAIWSAATFASGFADRFATLLLARAALGIGEAAYATIAPALLADLFPPERRGRVYAVFFSAIPVGSALGYVVGGLVDRALGWRAAFFVAGGPGLLLALATLFLADPPRGGQERGGAAGGGPGAYRRLLGNGTYALTVAGYAAYTAAVGAMGAWMPAFLERVRGLPRANATLRFGAIVVVTGFAGTFAGGFLGDALLRRTRQAYLWLCGVTTLLAFPLSLAALLSPTPWVYTAAMVGAQLLLFASTGPVNSAIVGVVSPLDRATAVGLSIFAIHAFGDVPSPILVGWLSDRAGLAAAVTLVPAAVLLAGAIWCVAAWRGTGASPTGGADRP